MNNKILLTGFFLIVSSIVFGQGGIDTNFGFNVQANVPADLRETMATDADTANIAFKYIGMRVRSDATNNTFEWTGDKWVSGGKVYSVATESDLSDIDCVSGNFAYVSGDDAWYYCNASSWVEFQSDLIQAVDDGNIYYISRNGGNDATAQKGRRDLPYYDIRNVPNMGAGEDNLIYFLPGVYDMDTVGTGAYIEWDAAAADSTQSMVGNDTLSYNYYFSPGTKIIQRAEGESNSNRSTLFYHKPSVDQEKETNINIFGEGDFIMETGGEAIFADWVNQKANLFWQGNELRAVVDTNDLNFSLAYNLFSGHSLKSSVLDFNQVIQGVTDIFSPLNFNPNGATLKFRAKTHELVHIDQELTGNEIARVWLYGNTSNDTMRNLSYLYDVETVKVTYVGNPDSINRIGYNFIFGRGDNRSNYANSSITYRIGNYIDIGGGIQPAILEAPPSPLAGGLFYAFTGKTETFFARSRSLVNTKLSLDFGTIRQEGMPIAISTQFLNMYDSTATTVKADYVRSEAHGYVDRASRVERHSSFLIDIEMCIGDTLAALGLSTFVDSTSTFIVSGNYVTNGDNVPAIGIDGAQVNASTGKYVFKDITVRNDGTVPAIEASEPCTLYVAGAFDYGNSPLDPDITFIRLNEFGETSDGIYGGSGVVNGRTNVTIGNADTLVFDIGDSGNNPVIIQNTRGFGGSLNLVLRGIGTGGGSSGASMRIENKTGDGPVQSNTFINTSTLSFNNPSSVGTVSSNKALRLRGSGPRSGPPNNIDITVGGNSSGSQANRISIKDGRSQSASYASEGIVYEWDDWSSLVNNSLAPKAITISGLEEENVTVDAQNHKLEFDNMGITRLNSDTTGSQSAAYAWNWSTLSSAPSYIHAFNPADPVNSLQEIRFNLGLGYMQFTDPEVGTVKTSDFLDGLVSDDQALSGATERLFTVDRFASQGFAIGYADGTLFAPNATWDEYIGLHPDLGPFMQLGNGSELVQAFINGALNYELRFNDGSGNLSTWQFRDNGVTASSATNGSYFTLNDGGASLIGSLRIPPGDDLYGYDIERRLLLNEGTGVVESKYIDYDKVEELDSIATLADTTAITIKYPGRLVWVNDDGNYWKVNASSYFEPLITEPARGQLIPSSDSVRLANQNDFTTIDGFAAADLNLITASGDTALVNDAGEQIGILAQYSGNLRIEASSAGQYRIEFAIYNGSSIISNTRSVISTDLAANEVKIIPFSSFGYIPRWNDDSEIKLRYKIDNTNGTIDVLNTNVFVQGL